MFILIVSIYISIIVGGIIPFAVVFIDYDELLKSLWHGEIHLFKLYGMTSCLLLSISTACVSIILIFFQLCNEVIYMFLFLLLFNILIYLSI